MKWSGKANTELVRAFLTLKTAPEMRRFLRDILTECEIEEFAKRLQAARLLTENVPYSAIEAKTGLSSTTVARVARWLHGGADGYALVLKRLKK